MDLWDAFDEHRTRWEADRDARRFEERRDHLTTETVAMFLVDSAAWLAWLSLAGGITPWPVALLTVGWGAAIGWRWWRLLRDRLVAPSEPPLPGRSGPRRAAGRSVPPRP